MYLYNRKKKFTVKNEGWFYTKNMKIYGRRIIGVDCDGNYMLSDWELLNKNSTTMYGCYDRDYTIGTHYVNIITAKKTFCIRLRSSTL
ncbi:MAG: hypothetical protein IJ149_02295 [Oscillospiraceae bacterium]|nr:hypothetical protein [Oscillospiraceae bacterium]